jgi:uncharacterized protein with beta-barrel porin domain
VAAEATGIDGGSGDDLIRTQGTIKLSAETSGNVDAQSQSDATVAFGSASSGAVSDASVDVEAKATGIEGGSGEDTVLIGDLVEVTAQSDGNVNSTSSANADTTFGDASSGSVSDASASRRVMAVGVDGGSGGDAIETAINALLAVTAESRGSVTSVARANADASLFGNASSSTVAAASSEGAAETVGIAGGADDDSVRNLGVLAATSEAALTVTNTSISIASSTFGDAFAGAASDSSVAGRAASKGISGDAGSDAIENQGTLGVSASAVTSIKAVTIALADSTFGSANTVAESRNTARAAVFASGIEGGEDIDVISSGGRIAVAGDSDVTVTALTVSGSGPASSDARTMATADVSGIDAGAGDDTVSNTSEMLVAAAPHIGVSKRTFGKNGYTDGQVGAQLTARANGIAGGQGRDMIANDGSILVVVGQQTDSTVSSPTPGGTTTLVDTEASGDILGKWLRVDLESAPSVFSIVEAFDPATGGITLRDPIPFDVPAGAAYTVFDVDAGEPDIEINTVDVGGRARVGAATEGKVTAHGIAGGEGDDTVTNTGDAVVRASTAIQAGTRIVARNVEADLRTKSSVQGVGIDGDLLDPDAVDPVGGADRLTNLGGVLVDAASSIDFSASQLTYSGTTTIDADGEASASAIGVRGGERDDVLLNAGSVASRSHASILATQRATAKFEYSDIQQQISFAAIGKSVGLSGGAGDDALSSTDSGVIDVEGTASASVLGTTTTTTWLSPPLYLFIGLQERTENLVDVTLEASGLGLELAGGNDHVENAGVLSVRALAIPTGFTDAATPEDCPTELCVARAESDYLFYRETGARATAANTAVAVGIGGEQGENTAVNTGRVEVEALSVATSYARASEVLGADDQSTVTDIDSSKVFVDDTLKGYEPELLEGKRLRFPGSTSDFLRLESSVSALDDALGSNQFQDEAVAGRDPELIVGTRLRFPDSELAGYVTEVVAFESDTGIYTLADDVPNDVEVSGAYSLSVVSATVESFDTGTGSFTLSDALPDDVADGAAYTLSIVSAPLGKTTFVDATRIGEEGADIVNSWIRFPGRDPDFSAVVREFDSDTGTFTLDRDIGFNLVEDDIYALSTTRDSTSGSTAVARAAGVDLGGGDAVVENTGQINATATARARTGVEAERGFAEARADAVAEAVGVRTKDGNDLIGNAGTIDILAVASATSASGGVEIGLRLAATGIVTSGGDDRVLNRGAITVRVEPDSETDQVTVIGIDTGEGDDLVGNAGLIQVALGGGYGSELAEKASANADTQVELSIFTGAGNDVVGLLPGSITIGDILLDSGDDTLVLTSTAVFSHITYADPDIDTFVLGGDIDGTFTLSEIGDEARYRGFDFFRKQGMSTWTLTVDKTIDWTVDQGTLALDANVVGTIDTSVGAEVAGIAVRPGRTLRAEGDASPVILNGGAILLNQGRIEALNATGDQLAVQVLGAGNSVVNEGEIEAAGVGGTRGLGVHVPGDSSRILNIGTVFNSGPEGAAVAVTGSGNDVTNIGLLQGQMTGLEIGGTGNRVQNSGEIRSLGASGQPGFGIHLWGDNGAIVNEGVVRNSAPWGAAIVLQGRDASALNRGSVIGERSSAVWFNAMQGVQNELVNEFGGTLRSATGPAVLGGSGNDRVENFGFIVGGGGLAIDLGTGSDALLIASTSSIRGNADAGTDTDTFILGGSGEAPFDLSQITRKYLGFERFRKEGSSTWTLTGNADGPWTVATGGILLEGWLRGDVLVEALGLLGGSGTAGSVRNYGTVAPGSSIGTLTVTRDYVHEAGGVLETELDGSGRSDLVRVGGRATLKGGTVKVIPLEEPGISTEYSILTAGKGVSGELDSAYSTWSILDPYLQYEPERVLLTVIRNDISFASFAKTSNQWAVGSALDANVLDPTKKAATRGDFKRAVDEFLVLSSDEASRALDALSGELHATVQSTVVRSGDRFLSVVADRRLGAATFSSGGKRVWVDALGFRGTIEDDGNASGADYRSGGIAAGFDWTARPELRIGAALGYSRGDTDLDRSGAGSADVESYHFGLYGEYARGPWQLQGAAAYGLHGIETARYLDYGSISRRAEADYNADQYSAYLRGSCDLRGPGGSLLQPFASLAYSQLHRESFKESGADSLDLDVDDETTESLYSTVGARAAWDLQWRQARIRPELRLGWAHQFLDRNGEITANFMATPRAAGYQSFEVRGVEAGRDSLVIGAGVTADVGKNAQVFLSYDGVVNGDLTEHALLGGVRVSW